MASPPYHPPATSPPFPTQIPLPNPKKRPSLHVPASAPSLKRRKQPSITSASSTHPLRQTSFPPEESAIFTGARSPSVESDFTAVTGGRSVVTTGTGVKKRGKGKGKKVEGSVKSGGKEKAGDAARRGTSEVPDDEDEDEEGGDGMMDDGEVVDKDAERKNLAVLVDAFNPDQTERYEAFRRVKLKKETVRKITNQTLSQSVPPSVITTINGYTKTFIGTIIERALEIKSQQSNLTPPATPPRKKIPVDPTDFQHTENPNNDIFSAASENDDITLNPAEFLNGDTSGDIGTPPQQLPKQSGPLLPDHLREALRRHKRDGEGGGAGLAGVSLGLGLPGTGAARMGGRRLFR